MDYLKIANEYYSKWLGKDDILNNDCNGVTFLHSSERNKIQYGYAKQFDLFIFYQPNKIILSYGDRLLGQIDELKTTIYTGISIESLKQITGRLLGGDLLHMIKYVFTGISNSKCNSKTLAASDYPQYLEFFLKNNADCKNTDWIYEYFIEMTSKHQCCGFFVNSILVSCTDTPGMPYMQDKVQEIGINTLDNFARKGYATDACTLCAKEIVVNGQCPQWSTTINNIASQKLAKKIGFIKLADVIAVTL